MFTTEMCSLNLCGFCLSVILFLYIFCACKLMCVLMPVYVYAHVYMEAKGQPQAF